MNAENKMPSQQNLKPPVSLLA